MKASLKPNEIEFELLRIYARSWNLLSFDLIEPYLADDVTYDSQSVYSSLVGKPEVSEYLEGKMLTIKSGLPDCKVFAEMGYCGNERSQRVQLLGSTGRPCVVIAQNGKDDLVGLILLDVEDGLIKTIGLCTAIPRPAMAIRTGEYPD